MIVLCVFAIYRYCVTMLQHYPIQLRWTRSHPERSNVSPNCWDQHQWGIFLADRFGGLHPPGHNPDFPTLHQTIAEGAIKPHDWVWSAMGAAPLLVSLTRTLHHTALHTYTDHRDDSRATEEPPRSGRVTPRIMEPPPGTSGISDGMRKIEPSHRAPPTSNSATALGGHQHTGRRLRHTLMVSLPRRTGGLHHWGGSPLASRRRRCDPHDTLPTCIFVIPAPRPPRRLHHPMTPFPGPPPPIPTRSQRPSDPATPLHSTPPRLRPLTRELYLCRT